MLAHGFGEGTPTLGVKVACGKNKHVKVFLEKVAEEVLARVVRKPSKRDAQVEKICRVVESMVPLAVEKSTVGIGFGSVESFVLT
jgi:hypothetical protein